MKTKKLLLLFILFFSLTTFSHAQVGKGKPQVQTSTSIIEPGRPRDCQKAPTPKVKKWMWVRRFPFLVKYRKQGCHMSVRFL
ncbi:MAG: hypothetical protein ACJ77K_10355 [Bacteroidia bacterium]